MHARGHFPVCQAAAPTAAASRWTRQSEVACIGGCTGISAELTGEKSPERLTNGGGSPTSVKR